MFDLLEDEFAEVAGPSAQVELLAWLDSLDTAVLEEGDLVETIEFWERVKSYVEARQAESIAELARRPVYARCGNPAERGRHAPVHAVADELSAALRWTPGHADGKTAEAVQLVEQLPATLAALREGKIDAYRARVLAEETAALRERPDLRARVETQALARAPRMTGPQLRRHVKKLVLAADPALAEDRRQKATAGRSVERPFPQPDGMADLRIAGPAEDVAAVYAAVDAAARARKQHRGGETRTLDQLRFDVLADLAWAPLRAGHLGCCHPDCPGPHAPSPPAARPCT